MASPARDKTDPMQSGAYTGDSVALTLPSADSNPNGPILFFDGECGLCRVLVRRLMALDRHGGLRFAPLQGATAQVWLRERGLPTDDFQSLIFLPEGLQGRCGHLRRTDGIVAALHAIGHPHLAGALRFLPRRGRDLGYRFVARTRHWIFGKTNPDESIPPKWKARLLP
jgi:predicted DCC family thiol-disulfide oxidoreductase YuxK